MTRRRQGSRLVLGIVGAAMAAGAIAQDVPLTREDEIIITGRRLTEGEVVRRLVPIGDLNVATFEGEREMERRVGEAVTVLCALTTPLPGYESRLNRSCRDEAWASARPQMIQAVERARWFGDALRSARRRN